MSRLAPALTALALMLSLASAPVASEVYRHVDEDGSVTFSDEPMDDDSEAMELESLPEVNLPDPAERERRSSPDQGEDNQTQEQQGYQTLEITSPEHDSAFWRGDGLVVVRFQSQPPLRSGHRYSLELDGKQVQQGRSTTFTLENMNRGTHELVVHVINADGETISSSDVTRFTLHRPSQLN